MHFLAFPLSQFAEDLIYLILQGAQSLSIIYVPLLDLDYLRFYLIIDLYYPV